MANGSPSFGNAAVFAGAAENPLGLTGSSRMAREDVAVTDDGDDVYKKKLIHLSKHYTKATRGISPLQEVSWKPSTKQKFEALKFKTLPEISLEHDYQVPGTDFSKSRQALSAFIEEVKTVLGSDKDPVGKILIRDAQIWLKCIDMLESKNTPDFYEKSKKLYGSSEDVLFGQFKLIDIAKKLDHFITEIIKKHPPEPRIVSSRVMVKVLQKRLDKFFGEENSIPVRETSGMESDADAGLGGINIRKGAEFRKKDARMLEVHEGWTHMGTAVNGHTQPFMQFLGESFPGADTIQEGLAALTEILSGAIYPMRAKKIVDRVIAINMAEHGANFNEIYHWHLGRNNQDPERAYIETSRVFHGGVVSGGAPFTRDIIYLKGIILVLKFISVALKNNRPELIPFLFVGNLRLTDIPSLYAISKQPGELIKPPEFYPKYFREENAEAVFSEFFKRFQFVLDSLIT